jgi:hypothetical protein
MVANLLKMERETGLEPATSSLGTGPMVGSKDLSVSVVLVRLKQALAKSATSLFSLSNRGTNVVHSRTSAASISLRDILWARNSNGSRCSASREPIGVLREFLRSQFTSGPY